ncbi:TPR domain-containing protein [Rutstroemia sp. NJR-2017a WRK4]|nr:TPR domain-containing protein [Rutstroemia sp. NJR-2017a WRK4]
MDDLDEAIRIGREAVDATPEDHLARTARLNNLGRHLSDRYSRTGVMNDLEEAIRIGREAVDTIPEDHIARAGLLNNLGNRLGDKYSRTGAMSDLEEAIRIGREAVDATPEDHPARATMLYNLGSRLSNRYSRTGVMNDLEEAIRIGREAVDTTPEDHPDRAKMLHNLGNLLGDRYSRTGAMNDLEEAIRIGREVVDTTPEDHPDHAGSLNTLGRHLSDRYSRTGVMNDLEEAIRIGREAVDTTPEDHPDRAGRLINLGSRLSNRYSRTGAVNDLEEAIRIGREAVDATPEDHPDRARMLLNLGSHLSYRYSRTGAMNDLEEAIRIGREAVDATPEDHPDRARMLLNLGNRLSYRYSRTGAMNDLEEAVLSYQSALVQSTSDIIDRLYAYEQVLVYCDILSDWKQACEAADIAIPLIPRLTSRSIENSDKQYMLSQVVGMACDGAAVALFSGRHPLDALNFIEQGRGVLAASLQELRIDVLDLKEKHPELAERFEDLQQELDSPITDNASLENNSRISFGQDRTTKRYDANKKLDELIERIRQLHGFEDFLLPPSKEEMLLAAQSGPLVVINVSKYRCDAILVEQHQIRSLHLPNLTTEEINEKSNANLGNPRTLKWLWDVVVQPILDALGFTQLPSDDSWPHIWWIPTGPLSKFPLHAAGYHGRSSTESTLNRVISSYSSSIKAVIHGRRHPVLNVIPYTPTKALLVAMQDTPNQNSLHFAKEETKTNEDDPSQSSLLLRDGRLRVANILETDLRKHSPFLAYLSACGTGQIKDEKFFDESIHLISAYQLAGFRHVVGTLWEVNDESCVDIARVTYEVIRDRGMTDESVSLGLHKAIRELRDRSLDESQKKRQTRIRIEKDSKASLDCKQETRNADSREQDNRLPRKIVEDDSDDEDNRPRGPLHWVPYVHFGV